MNKIKIIMLISLLFIFSLNACTAKEKKRENSSSSDLKTEVSDSDENQTETDVDGNVLVVFFSATGSTKNAAEIIAEILDADTFEIIPEKPYTDEDLNYNDAQSRVSLERNDESRQEIPLVHSVPDNWEQYSIIFIGYPIWWGNAAWPVDGFIRANDFDGKTVIPFCTSASSGFSDSDKRIRDLANAGNWMEGKRFSSSVSEKEIDDWIQGLDLDN